MTPWFWSFILYSFLGFLLEVGYAWATGGRCERKCLLVLPLCPVYGLGACAILWLPLWVQERPWALFILGGLTATATEYLVAVFYQRVLGVSFWDYQGLPGSLQGRVCLPFSLAWGTLALVLVYGVHPLLAPWLSAVPVPVSWIAAVTLAADLLISATLLRRTRDLASLQWYVSWRKRPG